MWHLSLVAAGLGMLPVPAAVMVLTTHVGRAGERFGFRSPITIGVLMMGAGLGLSSLLVDHSDFTLWWLPVVGVVGIGSGLSFPLLSAASVNGVPSDQLAAASAVNQCARQIGAALGVASTVSILSAMSGYGLPHAFRIAWLLSMSFCVLSAVSALMIQPAGGRFAQSRSTGATLKCDAEATGRSVHSVT